MIEVVGMTVGGGVRPVPILAQVSHKPNSCVEFPLAALTPRRAHAHAKGVCVSMRFAGVGLSGAFCEKLGATRVARVCGCGWWWYWRGMEDGFIWRPE